MDFLTALTGFNQASWLLIGGFVLLFVNIIYGWVRSARGSVKAGWFTVCLALVACIMIGVGTVQAASASATAARAGQFAGRGGGFNNQANAAGRANTNATSTASTVPVSNDNSAANQASTPESTNATPQLAGTPGRGNRSNPGQGAGQGAGAAFSGNTTATPQQSGTPGPQGNRGGAPGGTNTFSGGQRGSNAAGATPSTAAQPNQMGLQLAVIGGIAGLLLVLILYFRERRLTGFSLANLRGFVHLGSP